MTDTTAIAKFVESPENFPEYLRRTKDFEAGIVVTNYIYDMKNGADSMLDVVIKTMEDAWIPNEHEGERFFDFMIRKTKLDDVTIYRHTRLGEMEKLIPEPYKPIVHAMPVKNKNAIAGAVLEGHVFSDEQWLSIENARNYQDVAEVVREVTNKNPRSQWMRFKYDEETGIIWIEVDAGTFEFARINRDPEVQDVIERGKKRLFKQANITPKVRY